VIQSAARGDRAQHHRRSRRQDLLRHRHGFDTPVEDSSAPIHDHAGNVIGGVLVFHDVSETRALALKMIHLTQHDTLTGLPNRSQLHTPYRTGADHRRPASAARGAAVHRHRQFQAGQRALRPRRWRPRAAALAAQFRRSLPATS
jgi:hypothetical protein